MGGSSSVLNPQELAEFRKLNTSVENIEIPARPQNRNLTDRKGFLIVGIGIIIFLPFFGYSLAKSDLRRYLYGYDDCGNMCGQNNSKVEGISCSGQDFSDDPYYLSPGSSWDAFFGEFENSICVNISTCQNLLREVGMFGHCEQKLETGSDTKTGLLFSDRRVRRDTNSIFEEKENPLIYMKAKWWLFLVSIIITIGLCLLVLFLLRFAPGVVIWGVLIIGLLAFIVITGLFWHGYFTTKADDNRSANLTGGVIFTIITIIIIIVFIVLFKKIRLIVQLYKEATKAVFAMPRLILVPIVMTIVQLIIVIAFLSTTFRMFTSRDRKEIGTNQYRYEMTGIHIFTLIFNLIFTSWIMHIISGFQYMVIAGSVASWYFAKNKQYLDSPICTNLCNTIKYHFGSICLGASILTIMDVIRAMIRTLISNDKVRVCCECCCASIEAFLKFLSKNAYIEIAIHGQSFLRSGRRAAKLLITNAASVIAISSVGDFVLGMIIFILIVISTGISAAIWASHEGFVFPTIICFIVNIIIVAISFSIFSCTIETLFICFCEDKVINDGISKPYCMSRGLMEFVENSKKIYGDKGQK